jgi:hypothetical protein
MPDMKHVAMTQRKDRPIPVRPKPARRPGREAGAAFDVWLQRGLHTLFDDVTREPIPEELLRLIEDDRRRTKPAREDKAEAEFSEQTRSETARLTAQARKK